MDVNKSQTKILYLPLILIELYLIFSLFVFQFGPVNWMTENVGYFWFLIAIYHLSFILGYVLFVRKIKVSPKKIERSNLIGSFIVKYMWIFLFACTVLSLIKAMGLRSSYELIPWSLPSEFIKGLVNPGEQYYAKLVAAQLNNYTGSKITSGLVALFSFVVSSMIPVCVLLWNRINLPQKIVFFTIVFFEFATFVAVGTNKGVFDLLFIFTASITIDFLANYEGRKIKSLLKDKKILIGVVVFLLFFSLIFFAWTMKSRVGSSADYTASLVYTASMTEDATVPEVTTVPEATTVPEVTTEPEVTTVSSDENSDKQEDAVESKTESLFSNFVYGMSSYIGQGYYGMSLALGKDFTSTYGVGNSRFLSTNFKYFFGIDVEPYTFQAKISNRWDHYANWHSFYCYIANDVSFPGVAIIMFLLGASLSAIFKDAIYGNNIFAQSLLPMYAIMFLYMPANNQVFTFMHSFCAFFQLMILWYLSHKWKAHELN